MTSPQERYRQQFREKILALRPSTVLDVGCGDGALIRFLRDKGIAATGVESDPSLVEPGTGAGVVRGRAESLPFDDASVDMVVSEFSLHHFEDFDAAVAECLRVARRHVLFLDGWYDPTIASQQAAHAFDRWMKSIDRAAGETHNDVLDAERIAEAASFAGARVSFSYENWLVLEPMDPAKFDRLHGESLTKSGGDPDARAGFDHVASLVDRDGISEDGALFAALSHRPA